MSAERNILSLTWILIGWLLDRRLTGHMVNLGKPSIAFKEDHLLDRVSKQLALLSGIGIQDVSGRAQ